ncbi:hypothetical protein, partial [Komagataeibacter xylinus]|uniref:hypothetical protein n=1 Tax=Komagataeibacter xylinus TaxID=28448 RepID=UPI001C3F4B9E
LRERGSDLFTTSITLFQLKKPFLTAVSFVRTTREQPLSIAIFICIACLKNTRTSKEVSGFLTAGYWAKI